MAFAYRPLLEVPEGEIGDALSLTVVGQDEMPPGVGEGGCVEGQQGCPVLQGVKVVLGCHTEDTQVMGKIRAHHHLRKRERVTEYSSSTGYHTV